MRVPRAHAERVLTILVAAVTLAVTVSGAPGQGRRELRVGVPGVPAALDPATALEGAVPLITRQVFDTLVAYREGSTDVEPALATRWGISRDGLVWTFELREGVRFHDGTPLTAQEAVASFERHLNGSAGSVVWPALMRGAPGVVRMVSGVMVTQSSRYRVTMMPSSPKCSTSGLTPAAAAARALMASTRRSI